ncbi:response regulator [Paenibacillus albicereus]|uniref:Response regulator n=1 Tax=Paenibacillus albicereus TaxID=2726185 RepID=A0A6H2H1K6_9BACL|nr:response regulator [Paenibacillus albicereus]QJC53525.1 response regulator [Paenibacillus albicereus]
MYKLLIVEDEPVIREGLKHYLDWPELGVTDIREAANGREGLELALAARPDLIVTDIRMPEMDGLEMLERLRPELPNTAFVVLTGYGDFAYTQRAIRLGCIEDYLLKPLLYEESLAAVTRCLEGVERRRQEQGAHERALLEAGRQGADSWEPALEEAAAQSLREPASAEEQALQGQAALGQGVREPAALGNGPAVLPAEGPTLFEQIEAFILERLAQEVTLQMVAERFYYHPSYLSRLFKAKLDQNYLAFVTGIRIRHAQKLLRESRHLVADVGQLCGYKSYKHFAKTFREGCGLSPTEYRKRTGAWSG